MSKVFRLNSDNEFISPSTNKRVAVISYKGDVNDIIQGTDSYCSDDNWGTPPVYVGPGEECEALEVFGTAVEGDKFEQLVEELEAVEEFGRSHLFLNRSGLCIVSRITRPTIKAMRINDYLGWSRYGVKSPRDFSKFKVWSIADLLNGEALVDAQGKISGATEAAHTDRLEEKEVEPAAWKKELELVVRKKEVELVACKKEMEEKDAEVVGKEMELAACNKELEEKNVELAACKKELEWSKKFELRLSKYLVEEKEKVDELRNQLASCNFEG